MQTFQILDGRFDDKIIIKLLKQMKLQGHKLLEIELGLHLELHLLESWGIDLFVLDGQHEASEGDVVDLLG